MTEYKHFENKAVRMTAVYGEDQKIEKDNGIKIKSDLGEFTFFPSMILVDPVGDPIIYIKFNHKEKLVLYYLTKHPESRQALDKFILSVNITNMMKGENYTVRDLMDYIEEIENVIEKLKDGKIDLKDGIHPNMRDEFKQGEN